MVITFGGGCCCLGTKLCKDSSGRQLYKHTLTDFARAFKIERNISDAVNEMSHELFFCVCMEEFIR